jgi:hypothetical protein
MIRPIVSLFYTFAQVSLKTVFSSHLCQLAISNSFLVLTGQLVMTSSQSTIFFKWWEFFTTNKWISVYALFQWLKIVILSLIKFLQNSLCYFHGLLGLNSLRRLHFGICDICDFHGLSATSWVNVIFMAFSASTASTLVFVTSVTSTASQSLLPPGSMLFSWPPRPPNRDDPG